jgi:hypothetical protein
MKPHKRKKNIDHKLFNIHKNIKALKQKEKYSIKKIEWPRQMTHKIHTTQMKTNIKLKKALKPTWNHCIKEFSTPKILT